MATLEDIKNKINQLHGDMTYRRVIDKDLNYLESGRRADHDFVVKANLRTLRSGPHRGLIRVDGVIVVMFGKRKRSIVQTAIIREGASFLLHLDQMAATLGALGE